ncbi:MAG: menaquinone biosynthesis protein [Ferruginibacter sp.]
MDKKIRVGAVSYLNTKPLIYGFEMGNMANQVELFFDYPANIANMLLKDQIDIGLIPVAVIPILKEYHIISDYCIGASQAVASVCLFSDVPLTDIKLILVDYQSRTSAALLKILLKDYWNIEPELKETHEGYQEMIQGTTAGLIIGDRALKKRATSKYIYDLAEAWQNMTGLPFVFAAWVANKKMPVTFVDAFNKTTGMGLDHIIEIVAKHAFAEYDLDLYYTTNIDYFLDAKKVKGMDLFLSKLSLYQYTTLSI